ncbi:CGNR zinc finger domain-containing protein [Kibdelosporangium philippinense]|uniref:CGNR zinc finger domain-containing protein n=1 Tax=Kibdelosporangium philippinense TaxID=211113 RepID=A0ABS8ZWK8_9PSEU|nr:CGNR zinc finger domain-containing protein [Kibdelosporangium philippinense]MCE7010976.1 CGNR zinc finger domain-containing protein [Kibdelosporangium philippinense]
MLGDLGRDEALLLALLNSAPVIDGTPRDELDSAETWLAAQGRSPSDNPAAVLREARDALKAVIRGEAGASSLARFLADVRAVPAMTDNGLKWTLDSDSVAAQAVLAWDWLNSTSHGQLRPCANSECELFLIDRSKANNARWCSMAVCGNRMKARRHYQRSRQA